MMFLPPSLAEMIRIHFVQRNFITTKEKIVITVKWGQKMTRIGEKQRLTENNYVRELTEYIAVNCTG